MTARLVTGADADRGARPAARSRRIRPAWLLAWLAMVPVALIRARVLAESDTFWEIRTGQVILRTGHIPAADGFSWWARGRPWAPNSWGFDVLLALAYRAGGLACVALTGSALVLAAGAAILLLSRRLGACAPAAGLLVFAWSAGAFLWLSVRPQLIDYAAVPLLLLVAVRTGPALRARSLLIIAAIEAAWVNLHAAAPLGIAVLLCAGLGGQAAALRAVPPRARRPMLPRAAARALAPALAALAGTLASPRGAAVFGQLRGVASASAGLVTEWHHISPGDPGQLAMLAAGILAAAVAARHGRPDLACALCLLAAGGAYAIRVLPILDAVAAAVLAVALSGPRPRAWAGQGRRIVVLRVIAGGIVAALAAGAVTGLPHTGETPYPTGSLGDLPPGCRLFNSYLLGGIVILLRPGVPVSLDSRTDLYGRRDVLTQQRVLTSHSGGPGALRRLGVTCVLIPPSSGLGRQLGRSPRWRQVTSDPSGAVFLRRT